MCSIEKEYSEDRTIESIFKSAANITHIAPLASVGNASLNSNRGGTRGNIITIKEDEATEAYNDYFKGIEESLVDSKE